MIKFILNHFFLLCILLIGSVFYYLTMTTPGLQMDIQFATKMIPGKLQIKSAKGKLFSAFELQDIFYQNNFQTVKIKSFSVAWNPVGLLLHKLIIYSVNVNQASVIIPNIPTSAHSPSHNYLLNFLQDIRIGQARFNQVSIKLADIPIAMNGSLQKNWDVQWQANIPHAEKLLPDVKGALSIAGKVTGSLHAPVIKAVLLGKNLSYADQQIKQLNASVDLLVQPKITSTLTITATGIKINQDGVKPFDLSMQAHLSISGTLAKPEVSGVFHLANTTLHLLRLRINVQLIDLKGKFDVFRKVDFNGHLRSGQGTAQLQGSIDLSQPDYPVILQVKGSQLLAIDLPEYHVVISPDVTLNFVKQNLQLQGTIVIPAAQITPENFSSTTTLPDEVIFVGSKKAMTLPFTTRLQLTLQLGDKIHLAYHDLEANLGGNVQINQLPGTLINAVGELYTKNGTYTAYGQTLTIQTGRLIYTGGSLMNPGLNISAVKQLKTVNTGGNVSSFTGQTSLQAVYTGTQTISVGVDVAGTLENPTFSLFSTPPMLQGDILSYLVFGFPQSQANGKQYGAILSALSSLNPNTPSMGHFTKGIEEKLGLTQMSVESLQVFNPNATSSSNSVVSTTSLVIGKQLSNDLSIHYSVGLFYPVSILNLRYQLTKNWAIQSETSTLDNGADVLYSIERD